MKGVSTRTDCSQAVLTNSSLVMTMTASLQCPTGVQIPGVVGRTNAATTEWLKELVREQIG